MAKIQIKSEKLTPFGGIFSIMEQFDALLAQTIDSTLGLRCTMFGYQYSEILRSLMCVYLCGGSCIEDVTTHLMKHLSLHPTLRTCSADTILRAIEELTCKNITYKSASGNSYDKSRSPRPRSWRPASRSLTCWPPMQRAARSVCSAVQASARPC